MENERKLRQLERYIKHLIDLLNNPEMTSKPKYLLEQEYEECMAKFNELRVQL